ncbi:MAG: hypothetical protein ACOCYO_00490 [Bacteroidota bacterium]
MRKIKSIAIIIFLSAGLNACNGSEDAEKEENSTEPSKVEIRQSDGKYRLFVNGEPFFVEGAGCQYGPCTEIAAHGGNSFRTWSTGEEQHSAREALDSAWEEGLMVMMGLDVAKERHGFDYNNQEAVADQLERLRKEVESLKDHPALLGWGIGNELNLNYTNPRVWDAVNDIALMIKEVDGNHVVTTMLAGINADVVTEIEKRAPALDFLSIQMYADIINLPERLLDAGYEGPYLVTEWGATGHWEVEQTDWGSPIEQTSSEKADAIRERYQKAILANDEKCMGSFVFLWGQKQERTPSWYGLYTENGEKTEAIGVMQHLWTGKKPQHMAPRIISAIIDGKGGRFDNVRLDPNQTYTLQLDLEHEEKEKLKIRAEVMPEPKELSEGGDYEPRPPSLKGKIISNTYSDIVFEAPEEKGAYRIIVYAIDEHNNAATVNIPFYVQS